MLKDKRRFHSNVCDITFPQRSTAFVDAKWPMSLVLVLMLGTIWCVDARTEIAEVGHPPPMFELRDETGTVHNLSDHIGEPVILYFTHNMCHYCTQVIAFLKRAHAQYDGQGLTIMTINVWAEGEKLIRRYKEAFGLPFLMLAGKNRELLKNYEVNFVPIIVFVGKDGLVREIYHHFILEQDFKDAVHAIVTEQL